MAAPPVISTERLFLRSWQPTDAARLLPILEANVDHLGSWLPAHVAAPAALPDLEVRLAAFAADFESARSWRYAILSPDRREILGEVDLFPRCAKRRVGLASADRVEIGYWLGRDVTGRGFATEAARAMLEVARSLPAVDLAEIHCDSRNAASAAVPRRLGFRLATDGAPGAAGMMIWRLELRVPA